MEVSTLQYYIFCCFVSSTTLSTEDTSNTHRVFLIANCEVVLTKYMLFTIQSNELLSLVFILNDDMMTLNHVCIKTVHRLTVSHHDIVSDINDIIDWTQTDNIQFVFQPLWTFLYLTISNTQTSITTASISVLNCHINRKVMIVNLKCITRWAMQRSLITILCQPCIEVASYTIMA